ncbi:MAG: hypothetical protein LQ339_009049 [Xanthoria mediterranea]|nr:MAG: hypothetical protein LQ339_009049 [Xanthoria mediterranea]
MDPSKTSPEILQQDKGPLLVITIWVFGSLALIVVCLNFWTRLKVLHQSGLEDIFVLLAWVLSLVYSALMTAGVGSGLGKHVIAIKPIALLKALRLYTAALPFGMLSGTLPTLAIAIVLNKITVPAQRQLWLLYGIPTLNLIIRIVNVILVFTACRPAHMPAIYPRVSRCFGADIAHHYVYFAISFSAATDVFLTAWPMVAFWQLRIKRREKAVLLLLFSTTAIAAVCALVRIGYLHKVYKLDDFTYDTIEYSLWAACLSIEGNVIIITACVPGLRPFVKYLRHQFDWGRQPDILEIPKKSNRNSEITVPASSVSLHRMEPQPASFNNPGNNAPPESPVSTRDTQKLIAPAVQPEDVENQAFESRRESEDHKWRKEENTPVGDSPSTNENHHEQTSKKLEGVS